MCYDTTTVLQQTQHTGQKTEFLCLLKKMTSAQPEAPVKTEF